MYNVIIVDDEALAVRGIKAAINWEKLRVSSIYSAYNIRQAKEVFEKEKIDVLLCDIEMPQGSGIELLEWVRENYPETETIFLTCHADFSYAKQAIRLGSFDYILKPIPYDELEGVIAKAIDKIDVSRKLEEYGKFGKSLYKHQPILIESLWHDILNQTISSKLEDINEAAADRNVIFEEGTKFLPIIIKVQKWYKEFNNHEVKTMTYALKTVAMERLIKSSDDGQVIELKDGILAGILNVENNQDLEELKEACQIYIFLCNKYLNCDVCCYIGKEVTIEKVAAMVNELVAQDENNVAFSNKVFLLESRKCSNQNFIMPDMSLWAMMLNKDQKVKVVEEACGFIQSMVDKTELNTNMLYQFQQDFLQMIYGVLKQNGILPHKLLNEKKDVELHNQAVRSVANLILWIKHIVNKAMGYTSDVKGSQSVVDKAKKFIDEHIDGELTREDVSDHVFLNPDYLNRIFKKETGLSISEYILQERFKVAQELLLKTDMPVSSIAAQVGYTNFSHFAKMFRKYTDMNPADFRQNHLKQKLSQKF